MGSGRKRSLEEKQKLRAELDAVIKYNESELVKMQKQGWDNMTDAQKNILNNFACVAVETMRLCPPAYVKVAANNLERRIAEFKAKNEALIKEVIEKGKAATEKQDEFEKELTAMVEANPEANNVEL